MVNKSSFTNKLVVREQKKKTKTAAKIHSAEQGNAEINSNKLHLKIVLSPLLIPYTYFEARSRVVSKIRLLTNNEEMKSVYYDIPAEVIRQSYREPTKN